ncbi:MAG TPA: sulfite exporter TauE/SafE family protein [Bacteroidales bacterium]|nr:sulfite exporter TauE/SafE family protein [Bacteroidales bacterium]
MDIYNLAFAFGAALAAGFVNAIAGGGTLISFPALVAIGIPPVAANITNTIALCPGYFGGITAQRKDLLTQKQRLYKILPVGVAGGIAGGLLLLNTSENSFRTLIPYLILVATLLLAFQPMLKKIVEARLQQPIHHHKKNIVVLLVVFSAAIYGGYFGAGLGVILLAVLGLLIDDSLVKLNALKQAISLSVNVSAAVYFSFSEQVNWPVAIVMFFGSIVGGLFGGKTATVVRPVILRWAVVVIGFTVALVYLFKA